MTSLTEHSTFRATDRRFSEQVSIAQRTLVAMSTRRVSVRSKSLQHLLSRRLVSMTSVSRRSFPDLGAVVASCKVMLARIRLKTCASCNGKRILYVDS
jgi:hypothetical protein